MSNKNNNAEPFDKACIQKIEKRIGTHFTNPDILKESLTHRSYLNENPSWEIQHNERLEFLGDAVLELTVTEVLFIKYPDFEEGRLTGIRAALVNYQTLSRVARDLGLDEFVLMSHGETKDVGRARDSLLANTFEALLGALYLDGGYDRSKKFVTKHILVHVDEVIEKKLDKDVKNVFQELAQKRFKETPVYKKIEEAGPDHKKQFKVGVWIGKDKIAEGEGFSKQEAEQDAAQNGMYVFDTP